MGRLKRVTKTVAIYAGIVAVTLVLLDVALIVTGLFPPTVRPGHAELGWIAAPATGAFVQDGCLDLESGEVVRYDRNEDGLRTSHSRDELEGDTTLLTVAVGGDSHTELCAPNELTHFGVTERALSEAGVRPAVFAFGAGKYSVLQAYLAVKPAMERAHADAFVLNFYTGNDFYDILRVDDRPHLVRSGDGYEVAPPVWYQEQPPDVQPRSRVLHAVRTLGRATGISLAWVRIRYLRDVAADQGEGLFEVVGYMNDLRKATVPELEYPQAFVAQMLNQQLFFHHFPAASEESLHRIRSLMELVRRENPERVLLMSPIPSYQLVYGDQVEPAFLDMLERLPISNRSGVQEEEALYQELRTMAHETGWTFVDNLTRLRAAVGTAELYNHADYHIRPEASEIIGTDQAAAILGRLELEHE